MSCLPSDHLGRRVLPCPATAVRPSVCPSVAPLLPLYSPQYVTDSVHISHSYWTLLIMGSMCTFSRILWYFKILQIHWLVLGPALFTTLQPTICDESWSYLGQPLALARAWTLLIIGSLWLFLRMPQHFEILWIQTDWWLWVLVRYLSIAYNFTWILFIFSTTIGIS